MKNSMLNAFFLINQAFASFNQQLESIKEMFDWSLKNVVKEVHVWKSEEYSCTNNGKCTAEQIKIYNFRYTN